MQPIDPHILFDDEEEDDREVGYTPESIETDDPVLRFALHAMIADVLSLPFDGRPEVTAAYAARGIVGKAVNATTVPFLTIESIFGPHDFDDLLDRIMDLTISRERYERIHVMHELRNSFMPFDLWTKTQLDDAAMVVNPDFLGNIDQDFVEDLFDDLVEQVFGKKELALAAVRAARCEILARRQLHESLVAMPDEFFEGAGAVRRRKLELPRHAKTALDQAVDTVEAISRGKDALRKLMSACSGSDAPFATENQDDEPDEVSKQQAERELAVERDEASIEGWIPWGLGQDWKECSVLTDKPELLFAVHAMETFLHRLHKTKLRMPVVDDCIYSEKDGIIGDLSSSIEDEDDENEEACARSRLAWLPVSTLKTFCPPKDWRALADEIANLRYVARSPMGTISRERRIFERICPACGYPRRLDDIAGAIGFEFSPSFLSHCREDGISLLKHRVVRQMFHGDGDRCDRATAAAVMELCWNEDLFPRQDALTTDEIEALIRVFNDWRCDDNWGDPYHPYVAFPWEATMRRSRYIPGVSPGMRLEAFSKSIIQRMKWIREQRELVEETQRTAGTKEARINRIVALMLPMEAIHGAFEPDLFGYEEE